jgi:hypothetical protein
MIFYPIEYMAKAGVDEVLRVTCGQNAGALIRLLGNGRAFGLQIALAQAAATREFQRAIFSAVSALSSAAGVEPEVFGLASRNLANAAWHARSNRAVVAFWRRSDSGKDLDGGPFGRRSPTSG